MADEKKYIVPLIIEVEVIVRDPDVIERITGPGGDEWRAGLYPLHTRDDVLQMLADNAFRNQVDSASRLDGWGDMETQAATMKVNTDQTEFDLDLYPVREA